MYRLTYRRPHDLAEASHILTEEPDAKALAGGMTLVPSLKQRLLQVTSLVDITQIEGLSEIEIKADCLKIGALATHDTVAHSPAVQRSIPALAYLAGVIGDSQVRNCGTIGGSVANNDPAADYPAAVLALGGRVVTNHRAIEAEDFFHGLFSTALVQGEIVTALEFPIPRAAGYAKLPNPASRYATVGVFVIQSANETRVGVTGAATGVFRWADAETKLASTFDKNAIAGLRLDPADLNSDMHASSDYRAHVAGVMLEQAVTQAVRNSKLA